MKRVLMLVLSTDKDFYGNLHRASTETWDSQEIDGVETIFYFARTAAIHPEHDSKVLRVDSDDDFFSMGHKTLGAFEWALHHRGEWDFVFRANASLYVDKPGLLRYVQDKPETGLALGVVADCGDFEGDKHAFIWGPGYLLSRDVVERVVANKDLWRHKAMDDNALSMLLRDIDVPLDNRGSLASIAMNKGWYDFVYYENGVSGGKTLYSLDLLRAELPNQWAFRVKDDANRDNDVKLMKELHEVFK